MSGGRFLGAAKMPVPPLEPGEIRLELGRGRVLRCRPGDGDYEEMSVFFKPGLYVPGKGRVYAEDEEEAPAEAGGA